MPSQRDHLFAFSIGICVLAIVTIPYILASQSGGTDYVFNGFLLNPIDGNSYIAKMFQGWEGNWRFKLPYTADSGNGAYLFLFYIFLGHLARIVDLPLLLVFHAARLLGSSLLLWMLWRYFREVISTSRPRKLAFALAAFGSGIGWLLIPLGAFTSDFWVAEAYPFLSAYANPHFPIGLCLLLWIVLPRQEHGIRVRDSASLCLASLALSVINPFGVVIAIMILGGEILLGIVRKSWSQISLLRVILLTVCGLPLLIYDFWVASTDPVFDGWNAQNLTPSPPLWDLIAALSPALLLAIFYVWKMIRSSKETVFQGDGTSSKLAPLIVWAGLGLILMYFPVGLQRRFMMGLFIPLAGLSALALELIALEKPQRYRTSVIALFLLALPTNLVVLLAAFQGISTIDSKIYLTQSEAKALDWIVENTDSNALVLSGPETGLYIPSFTGRRVVYGHPFETVDADVQELAVAQFFSGELSTDEAQDFINAYGVDYIFYSSRERAFSEIPLSPNWVLKFQNDEVNLFEVRLP